MGAGNSYSVPVPCSATTVRACWQDLALAGTHGRAEGGGALSPLGKGLWQERTSHCVHLTAQCCKLKGKLPILMRESESLALSRPESFPESN